MVRQARFDSAQRKQGPAVLLCANAAPLFEEEWDSGLNALIADFGDPFLLNNPGAGAGFSSGNDPVDALEIQGSNTAKERFKRNEFVNCAAFAEVINSVNIV